jgi:hypothetical protein
MAKLVKLGDEKDPVPNMPETLVAAEALVKDGFDVMVYCSDDPIQARMLEDIGCVAVMPLASLIGSGMGILNPWNLSLIIEQAKCRCWSMPASVRRRMRHRHGTGLRWRADEHRHRRRAGPVRMARAMKLGVQAGREALSGGPHRASSPHRRRRRWRAGWRHAASARSQLRCRAAAQPRTAAPQPQPRRSRRRPCRHGSARSVPERDPCAGVCRTRSVRRRRPGAPTCATGRAPMR